MSPKIFTFICLLSVTGGLTAHCDKPAVLSDDTAGWQKMQDKDGVTVFARTRLGTSLKEFKGSGLIDMPPATVEKVLEDVTDYSHFMPYVAISKIVGHDGDAVLNYQLLDVPFIAARDYTVRVEHGTTGAAGAQVYRETWQTDNDAGPPTVSGTVRVKVNEGSWLLEPAGTNGAQTEATYQIFTDSGGVLPAFLANHASQVMIPKLFDALRKQVHDPRYAGVGQ